MDPISVTLGVLSTLHSAYGLWEKALNGDHPAHMIAKRLLVSASMYQSCLENFLQNKRHEEAKRDAKLVAFLQEDRALIQEVITLFETVAKRSKLVNLLIPKLDTVRKCERTMYERVEFLQLLLLMGIQTANQEDTESVRVAIADVEGRLMWYRHIGSKIRSATMQQLVEGIGTFMSEAFLLRRLSHIDYLLEAVCNKSDKSDTITAVEFGRALRRFGPLKDFYLKGAAVVSRKGVPVQWFKKNWSRREAEMGLGRAHPSCYAVRYSSQIGHDFVLSIVDNAGRSYHVLINNSFGGYSVVDELIKEPSLHSSLCACVEDCLRQPAFALIPEQRVLDWVHVEEWLAEMSDSMPTEEPRYPSAFGNFSPPTGTRSINSVAISGSSNSISGGNSTPNITSFTQVVVANLAHQQTPPPPSLTPFAAVFLPPRERSLETPQVHEELISPVFPRSNKAFFSSSTAPPPPPSFSSGSPFKQQPPQLDKEKEHDEEYKDEVCEIVKPPQILLPTTSSSAAANHIQRALKALESLPNSPAVVVGMLKLCLAEIARDAE